MVYLAEKFGEFIPTDPSARAECMSWLFWQMGSAHYLGGGLLEFVHDGTRPISLNINNGFRFKTWIEGYREFNRSQSDFFVWGFDMRNYQKISG